MNKKWLIIILIAIMVIAVGAVGVLGYSLYLAGKKAVDESNTFIGFSHDELMVETQGRRGWDMTNDSADFKIVKDEATWTFGRGVYTGGSGLAVSENFPAECGVDVGDNKCDVEIIAFPLNLTLTNKKQTYKKRIFVKDSKQTIAVEFVTEYSDPSLPESKYYVPMFGSIGVSEGYYVQYFGRNLDENMSELDELSKNLIPSEDYAVTYEVENKVYFSTAAQTQTLVGEGNSPVFDKEKKSVLFVNLSAEEMNKIYRYNIDSKQITSTTMPDSARLNSLVWLDSAQDYLLVGDGSSYTQRYMILRGANLSEIANFSGGSYRVIGDNIYFEALYQSPVRDNGRETDPSSIGISKVDFKTGKITVVKTPTSTNDYFITDLGNEGVIVD
jgi:hypothetical protein